MRCNAGDIQDWGRCLDVHMSGGGQFLQVKVSHS